MWSKGHRSDLFCEENGIKMKQKKNQTSFLCQFKNIKENCFEKKECDIDLLYKQVPPL